MWYSLKVLALSSVYPTEKKSQTYHQEKQVYHQGKHLYEKYVIIFDRRQLYQNCINITISDFSRESATGSCLLMIICIIATCLPSSESTYQPRLWITIRNFVNVRDVKFVSNLWERMTKIWTVFPQMKITNLLSAGKVSRNYMQIYLRSL